MFPPSVIFTVNHSAARRLARALFIRDPDQSLRNAVRSGRRLLMAAPNVT
jgi:hypothetical protein